MLSPDNVKTSDCARIYLGLSYKEFTLLWRNMWSSSWLVLKNTAYNRNTCLLQKSALKDKILIVVRFFLKTQVFCVIRVVHLLLGYTGILSLTGSKQFMFRFGGPISMKHCVQTNKFSEWWSKSLEDHWDLWLDSRWV